MQIFYLFQADDKNQITVTEKREKCSENKRTINFRRILKSNNPR